MGPVSGTAKLAADLDVSDLLESLGIRLRQALTTCTPDEQHGVLSVSVAVPDASIYSPPLLRPGSVYWSHPASGRYRFASGSADEFEVDGANRLVRLRDRLANLSGNWRHVDVDDTGVTPSMLFGFAFDPYDDEDRAGLPNAVLRVPMALLQRGPSGCTMTCSWLADGESFSADEVYGRWIRHAGDLFLQMAGSRGFPVTSQDIRRVGTEPGDEDWQNRVRDALQAIDSGLADKLVLSRRVLVEGSRRFDVSRILHWLEQEYATNAVFGWATEAGTLVGASPERLASLRESRVVVDALAGTAARVGEAGPDRRDGQHLLADPKVRHEHSLVVDDIVAAIEPLCSGVDHPAHPEVLQLRTLQHLWTPVEGKARGDKTLLDFAGRLHPTPAVGGYPRDAALEWLAQLGEHRGWYTGGLGWVNPDGEGEGTVVLRCAVLRDEHAELFAGAGIVADSDPRTELAETELKFQAMLQALAMA